MDALIAKVIALVVLFFLTITLGIIPYFIVKSKSENVSRREIILGYLNCFAGGVFLGTCLLHLLVEGRQEMDKVFEKNFNGTDFPWYEVVVGSGFFLIVYVEQFALLCMGGAVVAVVSNKWKNTETPGSHGYSSVTENTPLILEESTSEGDTVLSERKRSRHRTNQIERPISHSHEVGNLSQTSGLRAFLLLIALSFHTIFDGLAVGLQAEVSDVWEVFGATTIHKSLVAFCLGLQLFRTYSPRFKKAFGCLVCFALMSPIGIGIGMIVTSSNIDKVAEGYASGILQGVATGTFLYVTFFEILKDEISHHPGFLKVLVSCVGFAAIAGIKASDKA